MKKNSLWANIVHFAAHTFTGSVLFLIVGAPAVGLSMLIDLLGAAKLDGFTIAVLTLLEHAILLVDAALFATYLGLAALKSVKEMRK